MKRVLLILSILLAAGARAGAQDVGALQSRNNRLREEIATLESRIDSTTDNIRGQLTQYRLGQSLIASRQELLRGMEQELAVLNSRIAEKNQMILRLRQEHNHLLTAYESLLQQAYRHRDRKLWIMHILSSESASQAYRRWRYFRNYSDYMRTQEQKIRETQDSLVREETRLVSLQQERVQARDDVALEVSRMEKDQRLLDGNIKKMQQNEK